MASFEDLEVWKRAVEFSSALYKGLQNLKDYGFKDQLTRAGLSVPSNIAEGMERESPTDKVPFKVANALLAAAFSAVSRGQIGAANCKLAAGGSPPEPAWAGFLL